MEKKRFVCEEHKYSKDYYTRVMERAEKKWKDKMQPHVMTKEEVQGQEEGDERTKSAAQV